MTERVVYLIKADIRKDTAFTTEERELIDFSANDFAEELITIINASKRAAEMLSRDKAKKEQVEVQIVRGFIY